MLENESIKIKRRKNDNCIYVNKKMFYLIKIMLYLK